MPSKKAQKVKLSDLQQHIASAKAQLRQMRNDAIANCSSNSRVDYNTNLDEADSLLNHVSSALVRAEEILSLLPWKEIGEEDAPPQGT